MPEAPWAALIEQRKTPGALTVEQLDALLAQHPGDPILLWLRAAPPFWEQDWPGARAWIERAHAAGLEHAEFVLDRVEVLLSDPQVDVQTVSQLAQDAYGRLSDHPEHGPIIREQLWRALREEGSEALKTGRPQRAKGLYARALSLALGPDEVTRSHLSLGITQLNLAQPQAALTHLEAAADAPDAGVRARVASSAGTAWVRLSRADKAQAVLSQAIGTLESGSPERAGLLEQKRALGAPAKRGKKGRKKRR